MINSAKTDLKTAAEKIKDYDFVLCYMLSEIRLIRGSEYTQDILDECTELRAFSKDEELHILFNENKAVITAAADSDFMQTAYKLKDYYSKFGKHLIVNRYLDTDDDGQTYVVKTCLSEIR